MKTKYKCLYEITGRIEDVATFLVPISELPKEPEQEPVAYIKAAELEELKHCNGMSLWAENAAIHTEDSISKQLLPSGHVPVYTTPLQRTWVGLTDEEFDDLRDNNFGISPLISAVEAKLKEKNK